MSATADLKARTAELAAARQQRETADEDAARGRLRPLCGILDKAVRADLRARAKEAAPVLATADGEDWHDVCARYRLGVAELIVTSARELRHVLNESPLDQFLDRVHGLTHEELLTETPEARLWRQGTELVWAPVQAVEQLQRLRLLLAETLDAIAPREPGPVEELRFPPDQRPPRVSRTTYVPRFEEGNER